MQSDLDGNINWANQTNPQDTQSQIGNMMQSGGLVSGSPLMATSPLAQINPLNMAHGGQVDETPNALIAKIREEFHRRGLNFDRYMAQRMVHGNK